MAFASLYPKGEPFFQNQKAIISNYFRNNTRKIKTAHGMLLT